MARVFRRDRTALEREAALSLERRIWSETGASYAAELASAATDDLLRPLVTRGPDITFTDEELKDF